MATAAKAVLATVTLAVIGSIAFLANTLQPHTGEGAAPPSISEAIIDSVTVLRERLYTLSGLGGDEDAAAVDVGTVENTSTNEVEVENTEDAPKKAPMAAASPTRLVRKASLSVKVDTPPPSTHVREPSPPPSPGTRAAVAVDEGRQQAKDALPKTRNPKAAKRFRKRRMAAEEMADTEERYLRSLEKGIAVYGRGLKQVLSKADYNQVFSLMTTLCSMNRPLLDDLQQAVVDFKPESMISHAFEGKHMELFKLYGVYAAQFDAMLEVIDRNSGHSKEFSALMTELRVLAESQPLQSFLIMPVQRVMRYTLLLREYLEHTPESHPDFKGATKALERMSGLATTVNEKKRVSEQMMGVLEAQEELGVALISPSRVLHLKVGSVQYQRRLPRGSFKPHAKSCTLYLFNDMVLVARATSSLVKNSKLRVYKRTSMRGVVLAQHPSLSFALILSPVGGCSTTLKGKGKAKASPPPSANTSDTEDPEETITEDMLLTFGSNAVAAKFLRTFKEISAEYHSRRGTLAQ